MTRQSLLSSSLPSAWQLVCPAGGVSSAQRCQRKRALTQSVSLQ